MSELLNRSPALVDYNLFISHSALREALVREGGAAEAGELTALGARLGSVTMFTPGDLANRNGAGRDPRFDRYRSALLLDLADTPDGELRARELTQRIALTAQAALLLAHGPASSAEAFLASRLAAGPPAAFGTLPRGSDFTALTRRILEL